MTNLKATTSSTMTMTLETPPSDGHDTGDGYCDGDGDGDGYCDGGGDAGCQGTEECGCVRDRACRGHATNRVDAKEDEVRCFKSSTSKFRFVHVQSVGESSE